MFKDINPLQQSSSSNTKLNEIEDILDDTIGKFYAYVISYYDSFNDEYNIKQCYRIRKLIISDHELEKNILYDFAINYLNLKLLVPTIPSNDDSKYTNAFAVNKISDFLKYDLHYSDHPILNYILTMKNSMTDFGYEKLLHFDYIYFLSDDIPEYGSDAWITSPYWQIIEKHLFSKDKTNDLYKFLLHDF